MAVYLGIGSNVNREVNLRAGIAALRSRFGKVILSQVYRNPAVGFAGEHFFNLAARIYTDLDVPALHKELHLIEEQCGRIRNAHKYSDRTLDIDILLYGDVACEQSGMKLPRPEIQTRAFVLCPLAEIAADVVHPVAGRTIAQLWQDFYEPYDLQQVPLDFPEFA